MTSPVISADLEQITKIITRFDVLHLRNIYCLFSVDQRGSDDDRALAS